MSAIGGPFANAPRRVDARSLVQIFMGAEWKPVAPEEQTLMSEHMACGELQFEIDARGQTYQIDLSLDGPQGATQTNVKSGKVRKLRLVDPDEDDGGDADAFGPSASGGTDEEAPA